MPAKSGRTALKVPCPRCGSECSLRVDRLDRTQYCRNCNVGMYISAKGSCDIDRRKADKRRHNRWQFGKRIVNSRFGIAVSSLGRLASARWLGLRQHTRWLLATATTITLLLVAGSWMVVAWTQMTDTSEQADSLTVRASVVGQALVYNDSGLLAGIAEPGTIEDLEKWLRVARPQRWGRLTDLEKSPQVTARVMFKDDANRKAGLSIRVTLHPESSAATGPGAAGEELDKPFEGMVFWALGPDGKWLLDGARTYKEHLTLRDTD